MMNHIGTKQINEGITLMSPVNHYVHINPPKEDTKYTSIKKENLYRAEILFNRYPITI